MMMSKTNIRDMELPIGTTMTTEVIATSDPKILDVSFIWKKGSARYTIGTQSVLAVLTGRGRVDVIHTAENKMILNVDKYSFNNLVNANREEKLIELNKEWLDRVKSNFEQREEELKEKYDTARFEFFGGEPKTITVQVFKGEEDIYEQGILERLDTGGIKVTHLDGIAYYEPEKFISVKETKFVKNINPFRGAI